MKRCLIKDPQRRYQSARDLQTDLEDLKQDVDSGVLSAPSTISPGLFESDEIWPGGARLLGYAINPAKHGPQAATVTIDGGVLEFLDGVPSNGGPLPDATAGLYENSRNGTTGLFLKSLPDGPDRLLVDLGHDHARTRAVTFDSRTVAYVRSRSTRDVVLIKAK